MRKARVVLAVLLSLAAAGSAGAEAQQTNAAPRVEFITVEPGVRLQVLDWGGPPPHGPKSALVFLSGLGLTAHEFDGFAPQFVGQYHVYGITRRGFGDSSRPEPTLANYSAERLGEDVLAVIAALHLDRPVLAGHSIAGEEMSWVGSVHPEKVAGLIYLDAAYAFAYDARLPDDWWMGMIDLRQRIEALRAGATIDAQYAREFLESTKRLEIASQALVQQMASLPGPPPPAPSPIPLAVIFGEEEFTRIQTPAMAIFACPHSLRSLPIPVTGASGQAQALLQRQDAARCTAQSDAFEKGNPSDPVVRIANADHAVFNSNPKEVERAMNDFLAKLR